MDLKEIWMPVIGFDNYLVSDTGRVWVKEKVVRVKYRPGDDRVRIEKARELKPNTNKDTGYKYIILTIDGKHTTCTIHRLMAKAFLPNPENKPCINHINSIRHDNRIENLEWCTYSENNQHMHNKHKKS